MCASPQKRRYGPPSLSSLDALPGTQVLVDANGWLRVVSRSGALIQIGLARDIVAHPLPINAAAPGAHHH